MVPIRQLEALVALADHEHLGRAGASLGTTTSAMSGLLQRLERTVGFVVARRTSRRVALTSGASALVERAREILLAVAAWEAQAESVAEGRAGLLRIGISADCRNDSDDAVRALEQIGLDWPVQVTTGRPGELGDRLDGGHLDLVITRWPTARRARPWWQKPWAIPRPARLSLCLDGPPRRSVRLRRGDAAAARPRHVVWVESDHTPGVELAVKRMRELVGSSERRWRPGTI